MKTIMAHWDDYRKDMDPLHRIVIDSDPKYFMIFLAGAASGVNSVKNGGDVDTLADEIIDQFETL